jgi:hypothetical protein
MGESKDIIDTAITVARSHGLLPMVVYQAYLNDRLLEAEYERLGAEAEAIGGRAVAGGDSK